MYQIAKVHSGYGHYGFCYQIGTTGNSVCLSNGFEVLTCGT
jgi:hypothetical protein